MRWCTVSFKVLTSVILVIFLNSEKYLAVTNLEYK